MTNKIEWKTTPINLGGYSNKIRVFTIERNYTYNNIGDKYILTISLPGYNPDYKSYAFLEESLKDKAEFIFNEWLKLAGLTYEL